MFFVLAASSGLISNDFFVSSSIFAGMPPLPPVAAATRSRIFRQISSEFPLSPNICVMSFNAEFFIETSCSS